MGWMSTKWFVVAGFVVCVLAGETAVCAQETEDPALDLYYSANSLCYRRFYKLAVDEYKAFLGKYPTHVKAQKARWGLALAYYNLGELKEAEPILAKLVGNREVTAQDQVHNLWGSCLLELKRPADAEKAFAWTIANIKDPKSQHVTNARLGLLEALFLQAKWDEAVKTSEELLKAVPDSPHADKVSFQQAVARLKLKQYDVALAEFRRLAEQSKDAELAHRALFHQAEGLQQMGKYAAAAVLYEKAATRKGTYSEFAQYNLGLVLFLQKEYAKAIEALKAFRKSYPASSLSSQAALYLGRSYVEAGEYNSVSAVLSPLTREKGPIAGQAMLWYVRGYARRKRPESVEERLEPVMGRFADDAAYPALLYELATAQMQQNKYDEAAKTYARAAAAAGNDPEHKAESVHLQAFCLHQAGQFIASAKLCEAFLKAHPSNAKAPDVILLLAENCMLQKKFPEALAQYGKLLSGAASAERANLARLRRAQIYCNQKQWKQALEDLINLPPDVTGEPTFRQVKFMIGDCYLRLEQWSPAVASLEAFIKEQPFQANVDTAMYNLSLAYQRKDEPDKAVEVLTKLIEDQYRDRRGHKGQHLQQARLELGRLLYEAQRYKEAKGYLEGAIKTYREARATGDGNAEYYLAWIALKENDHDDAAKYFDALRKIPNHPFATDSALQTAILYIRSGKHREAENALEKMLKDEPGHVKADQASYYLGLCRAQRGKYDEALKLFETVLTKYPKSDKADNALYWQAVCQEKLAKDGSKRAAETYEQLVQRYPNSEVAADAVLELAKIQFEGGEDLAVITRIQALLAGERGKRLSRAQHQRALYLLGWSCFKADRMTDAAEAFDAMIALGTEGDEEMRASAYFQAGEARRILKEYDRARSQFAMAAALSKGATHEPALLRRGECEGLAGRWRDSENTCEEFVKKYPRSKLAPQARYQLGWALQNQRKYTDAIKEYRKVVAGGRRDENAARAQFQLGECLVHLNQLDEAVKELVRVEASYSFPEQSSKAIIEIGRVHEMRKEHSQAIARYNEVIRRFPKTAAATVAKQLLSKHE